MIIVFNITVYQNLGNISDPRLEIIHFDFFLFPIDNNIYFT